MNEPQAAARRETIEKVLRALQDDGIGGDLLHLIRAHNILQRHLEADTGAEPDKDEAQFFMPAGMKAVYDAIDNILGPNG